MRAARASKGNEARYDQASELLVGPPSRSLTVGEVAQSAYIAHHPPPPPFTHKITDAGLAELAQRCSTKAVQGEVRGWMQDRRTVDVLRKRMAVWLEAGEVDAARPTSRPQSGAAIDVAGEDLAGVDDVVPDAFKFLAHPRLASAYYQRDGRLEQTCIARPVPTHLLNTPKPGSPSVQDARRASPPSPRSVMVLCISIYARPVRGMWAKEKVRQTVDADAAAGSDDEGSPSETSPEGDRGLRTGKGQRGLYGALSLVEKVEVRSDGTLQDLRNAFLCRMDDLPEAEAAEGRLPRYTGRKRQTDSCFLIEGVLYSERSSGSAGSYAAMLETPLSVQAASSKMADVGLDSLSLCTGKLYWYLHQGSCEHLWTVTTMRVCDGTRYAAALYPLATYYAYGATLRPVIKWARPKSNTEAQTLGKCDICKACQATLVVVGGSKYRPPSGAVTLVGLKGDVSAICDHCWSALMARPAPSIAERIERAGTHCVVDLAADARSPSQENLTWTVIPALD